MREIPLTRGMVAFVDDEDYEYLNQFKWNAHKCNRSNKNYYALRHLSRKVDPKRKIVSMHAMIMGTKEGYEIDHINGNCLDNRRENLRFATHRQNGQNRHEAKTSKYPGVNWHKKSQKWKAEAQINGKNQYIGLFTSEEAAFEAYVNTLKEYIGTENTVFTQCS